MVMHANRLLGVPQMRQLRINNASCTIPDQFSEKIKVCYGPYDEAQEDKEPFGLGWRNYTSRDA